MSEWDCETFKIHQRQHWSMYKRYATFLSNFVWFGLLMVELWRNKVLQVAKMVLSLEQGAFIVKRYYETHSLKHVCNNFIEEFSNSVSPSNHAILNSIKKFENEHTLDNLPAMPTTLSWWLGQRISLSHMPTYITFCFIVYHAKFWFNTS